ncbi:endonuclease/exonuclease/phosphatase family protein [Nocardia transvalensis]|uniref:endonuclease/exonuclease/phosphatase family protein n=1 Tax=Nocardia transvalensis TaxID=37333 RepID=UPI0018941021|nr:endonuclease/exonuclease/phosphatase family protein [Nocardia transvalensis]MBF6330779.1 endonuclease/exonuclease/phosphatase family protein [Nocardia transvalensis]
MSRHSWLITVLAGVLAAVLGLGPTPAHRASAQPPTTQVTVMTFNIWVGGTRVDFKKVSEAIVASGADIVGVQESNNNLNRLANDLGWKHVHAPLQIISKHPIIVPQGSSDYVYVEVSPGRVVAVSNVHLRPYPYGPYDLRDGATAEKVLANEQYHMKEMAGRFNSLPALANSGVPVFLTGDFNVPSHLDWTAATAAVTPRPFDRELRWPVSARLAELGFRDSLRERHSDSIAKPAYTWTPGYPSPSVEANEVHDRIDFVYAAGPSTTLDSKVIAEPAPAQPLPGDFGGPHADVVISPWPSDHRAVASTFQVTPAPAPRCPSARRQASRSNSARVPEEHSMPSAS